MKNEKGKRKKEKWKMKKEKGKRKKGKGSAIGIADPNSYYWSKIICGDRFHRQ